MVPANSAEPETLKKVASFHGMFGVPVQPEPMIPADDRCQLRISLLQEELDELKAAMAVNDLVECADAFADLQYVLSGAILEFGMQSRFKAFFDEVHRSNMSKACRSIEEAEKTVEHYKTRGMESQIFTSKAEPGKWLVKRVPDGNLLKSVGYSPPNLAPLISSNLNCEATAWAEAQALTDVAAFHALYDLPLGDGCPKMLPEARCKLRASLLQEELDELKEAIEQHDLVECADAFADLQYVLSGAIIEFGMQHNFKAMFDEVHRSNMSKACSTLEEAEETILYYKEKKGMDARISVCDADPSKWLVTRVPDSKVLKSIRYSAPNLRPFVESGYKAQTETPEPKCAISRLELHSVPQSARFTPQKSSFDKPKVSSQTDLDTTIKVLFLESTVDETMNVG